MVRKNTGEFEVSQSFFLDKDEAIYGLGTIQNGKMNRRGEKKRMEQSNLEDFQNVLQSIKGWGLYWENYSPTLFEDNAEGMSFTSEAGQGIDYYFMYGGSADGVIAQMRHLTGDVPMFPLWTYGYWQSKERYKTAAETESIVDQYRALQVPLDGIIQDWQYWGSNYLWNAMDFLSEDFATGPQLIKNVHAKHAHFMISIWASFGPQTQQFRELNEKGLLMPFETWPQSGISHIWPPVMKYPSGVKVYDAFSPEARAIYWKYLKTLYDYGCDAWWMDSTDPDFFNPRESDYAHKVYGGTWRSQRNAFPLETVRGIYQAQRKEANSQKRIFIMTRSSFAGQQHYGSNMWSGDVNSSWDMLRKQVPAGLSFSLTGNPNFNTDIGGFFCGSYNTQGPASAPKNPQFQELYVRWMQYGLFCPVFRSHGADAPREIWQFGKKGEPVYDAIEKMIRLRYRLLPYLYSTAWQVTSNNDSYMRPLFSDFASDKKVWNMTDEFMFGRCILAAPIVDPQYTEEKIIRTDAMTGWDRKSVSDGSPVGTIDFTATKTAVKYLPKGATWYDFWTNKAYKGGRNVTLETTFDRVPMFVRAGSILPLGPEMQYVGEKAWDNLELRVYPGADGRFVLYEDEGDNYNYEKGAYSTITLQWNDKKHTLTIGARKGEYPGMLQSRAFTVVWPDGTSNTVNYQGQEINIKH
jgi:alpha-D-xyloside xylohydrolase